MHGLLFAAGLLLFFTPPSSFPLLCQPSSAFQSTEQRAFGVQSAGGAVGGQVRTEKGERKRSLTQAQSDGSRLSCSALCPWCCYFDSNSHIWGPQTPSTTHALPPPPRGLRQGRGKEGEMLPQPASIISRTKRIKSPEQSFFHQPPSL